MSYFDYNATTPLLSIAEKTWIKASREHWYNPSSPYSLSARARNYLDHLRSDLASHLGCEAETIIFNSGATEGNNAVFNYMAKKSDPLSRVLISSIEHPCVLESAEETFPDKVDFIPVSHNGVVDMDILPGLLKKEKYQLVSVMAANNETGVIQPWRDILKLCHKYKITYHCDASQWVGKLPSNDLGQCDFITGCGHKFGGPKGVGFLKIAKEFSDFKDFQGGEQESGHRGGTENIPGVAAMIAALNEISINYRDTINNQKKRVSEFSGLIQTKVPGVKIIGQDVDRLWNTLSIILPDFGNLRWVLRLDKHGFAVSTGSACATGKEGPSHVLAAMKYHPGEMNRVIRISGGWDTSSEEWQSLVDAFGCVWTELKESQLESGSTEIISL